MQKQLREQSIRDPLTGLYNRRFFDETLVRELIRVERANEPLSLIVVDIDLFKSINDRYGHASGDLMLKRLAVVLNSHIRGSDVACRFGGDEFAVILPNATPELAIERAHEIRDAFAKSAVMLNGEDVQCTISVGVASYPTNAASGRAVFIAADRAMYIAKEEGRNNVQIYGDFVD